MEENDIPQEIVNSLGVSPSLKSLNNLTMAHIDNATGSNYKLVAILHFKITGEMDGPINILPTNQHERYLKSFADEECVLTFLFATRFMFQ